MSESKKYHLDLKEGDYPWENLLWQSVLNTYCRPLGVSGQCWPKTWTKQPLL